MFIKVTTMVMGMVMKKVGTRRNGSFAGPNLHVVLVEARCCRLWLWTERQVVFIKVTTMMMAMAMKKVAQHTLTWITRIHSLTYINTVTTMLCEAPAQLLQNYE